MKHLHQHIAVRVDQWRSGNFACGDYSAIAEVLEWAKETETGNLRFLRRPQLRALVLADNEKEKDRNLPAARRLCHMDR